MAAAAAADEGWPEVSTFENPRNLSPEKKIVLKEFWAKLLVLFHTQESIVKEYIKLFPAFKDDAEDEQLQQALKDFTPATFKDEFYKLLRHDYADLLPMRFLRARGYEQDKAMRMLFIALAYRRIAIPRAMMSEANFDIDFIAAIKKGKSFVPCYDDSGRTITCIRIKNHSRGDCSQDIFERYTLYAMEHAHLLHHPYQDRTVLLVDMTGFSITSLDLGSIKFIIQNFEQYYPEELSEGVIHNAPWLFGTAWSLIKPLLRQPTREKITFTSNVTELAAKIGKAPAEKVLKAQMEYVPKPPTEPEFVDQTKDLANASQECRDALLTWNENVARLEELTQEWSRPPASDTPMEEIEALDGRRQEACWTLSRSYWPIDPFIRPKSYHDRAGLLPPSRENALTVTVPKDAPSVPTSSRASLKSQKSTLSISKTSSK